jgi:hypothetical protein
MIIIYICKLLKLAIRADRHHPVQQQQLSVSLFLPEFLPLRLIQCSLSKCFPPTAKIQTHSLITLSDYFLLPSGFAHSHIYSLTESLTPSLINIPLASLYLTLAMLQTPSLRDSIPSSLSDTLNPRLTPSK